MRTARPTREARFPRLRELRETILGWDVVELASRLNHKPSIASIYRIEAGQGVRPSTARRVFDVVNAALNNSLDPAKELVFDQKRSTKSEEAPVS